MEIIKFFALIFSIIYVVRFVIALIIELVNEEPTSIKVPKVYELTLMGGLSYIITYFFIL